MEEWSYFLSHWGVSVVFLSAAFLFLLVGFFREARGILSGFGLALTSAGLVWGFLSEMSLLEASFAVALVLICALSGTLLAKKRGDLQ